MKNILEAFRVVTFWFSPVLINICLFGSFVLAGGTLTPATTFVLLSTVNVIQVKIKITH